MKTLPAIGIAPLAAAEFETAARWLATPAINRWLTSEWRDRDVNATALAIAARNRRNRFFLVRCGGEPCGLVALSDFDAADKTANLWYLLGEPRFAGTGVTSAAVRDLVTLAFRDFGLHALHAWAMQQNAASLRVLRKTGFREAGRLRHSACLDGHPTDRILFDLLASEWPVDADAA